MQSGRHRRQPQGHAETDRGPGQEPLGSPGARRDDQTTQDRAKPHSRVEHPEGPRSPAECDLDQEGHDHGEVVRERPDHEHGQ